MSQEKTIISSQETFGGWFEDFQGGQILKHWPGKTITEMDNHLFSLLTMNDNPLHTDENYMSEHKHGKILIADCFRSNVKKKSHYRPPGGGHYLSDVIKGFNMNNLKVVKKEEITKNWLLI